MARRRQEWQVADSDAVQEPAALVGSVVADVVGLPREDAGEILVVAVGCDLLKVDGQVGSNRTEDFVLIHMAAFMG